MQGESGISQKTENRKYSKTKRTQVNRMEKDEGAKLKELQMRKLRPVGTTRK